MKLNDEQKTELLDWVSACQSAYHIASTLGHPFAGIGNKLQENRDGLVDYVESLLEDVMPAQAAPIKEGAFSCARRAADPGNEFAACRKPCGDTDACITAIDAAPAPTAPSGWAAYVTVAEGQLLKPSRHVPDGTYALIERSAWDGHTPAQTAPTAPSDTAIAALKAIETMANEINQRPPTTWRSDTSRIIDYMATMTWIWERAYSEIASRN